MANVTQVLLDKQPSWFFNISALILIAILLVILFWVFRGAKKYHDAVGKENRLTELLEERNTLQNESAIQKNISSQLEVVLGNAKSFMDTYNEYTKEDKQRRPDPYTLIQRIIESLASDIKTVVGEKHRCGFWAEFGIDGKLTLVNGSAGFPNSYSFSRTLDINNSVAGRSYRKKESFCIDNVTLDPDWTVSEQASSYTSLICIPVGSWGVITIDAKQPMNNSALLVGELYGSIIHSIFDEAFFNTSSFEGNSEEDFEEDFEEQSEMEITNV